MRIEIEEHPDGFLSGWSVSQGDKYADRLTYEEMIGLVAALTMPTRRTCLSWMRTKEQNEASRTILNTSNGL